MSLFSYLPEIQLLRVNLDCTKPVCSTTSAMSKSLLIHRGTYAMIPVVLCKILLFTSLLNQKADVEHSRSKFTEIDVNYQNTLFLFCGPCIFNNEDKKINQQNAQINSGLIYY